MFYGSTVEHRQGSMISDPYESRHVLAKFHENPSILHTLLIHLKRRHFVEMVVRVFAFKRFTSISRLL